MSSHQASFRLRRNTLRDRRGVSTLVFAATSVLVIGGLALAADVGSIYAARRGAQNAADAAAAGAAIALSLGAQQAAIASGRDIVARNGFPHGGNNNVAVNIPPLSGAHTGNATAVEVVVRQQTTLNAATSFLSPPPTVQGRAVATLRQSANVCVLSLTGPVTAAGNTAVSAPTCVIASNARGDGSIQVSGNSLALTAFTLNAVGSCVGCTRSGVTLTQPFGEWQVPATNPFAHLDAKTIPGNGLNLLHPDGQLSNVLPFETNGGRRMAGLQVTGTRVLSLTPGTYIIHNGDFDVQSGTVVCPTCTGGAGVTIVFTGDPANIGGMKLNANGTMVLRAPNTPADPDWRGVLFFRDPRATSNPTNNPAVQINGGMTTQLRGGMYFPNSHVRFNGNAGSSACSVVVAGSIEFSGNAGVALCAETGTATPRTRQVAISE